MRLRVKDVDFDRGEIVVRDGKGGKDRVTVLPENLILPLQQQLSSARALHDKDLQEGLGRVWLPDALSLKYPGAARTWGWQWVFPSAVRSAPLAPTPPARPRSLAGSWAPPASAAAARAAAAADNSSAEITTPRARPMRSGLTARPSAGQRRQR